jgi:pimeloyl-ACP methyl ester carboxylesterase
MNNWSMCHSLVLLWLRHACLRLTNADQPIRLPGSFLALEYPMSYTYRAMFPALCLALILPCALPVQAADPAPAKPAEVKEPPPPEYAPLLQRTQEDAIALERSLPQADLQKLQAGDDNFLALWKPANTDDPKGTVVIVPGADESADWPEAVGPLRRKLPDAGWASLSITLPDALSDGSDPREEDAATGEASTGDKDKKEAAKKEPAKDAPKDAAATEASAAAAAEKEAAATAAKAAAAQEREKAAADRIFARIDSAIAFAQQNKARTIVLLGHGNGAYWAARYTSEKPSPLVQHFVMVSAREPVDAKPLLAALVPTLKVKTSDFVFKGWPNEQRAAQDRLQASKRVKGSAFTQIQLTAIPGNKAAEQEQMFRRVRGWLEAK